MKKVLVTLALFCWSIAAGELLNGLAYGQGITLALVTESLNTAEAIASMAARIVTFIGVTAVAFILTVPVALYLRRRMSNLFSSLGAALLPCLSSLMLEIAYVGTMTEGAVKTGMLLLVQSFLTGSAAVRVWPSRSEDIENIFG